MDTKRKLTPNKVCTWKLVEYVLWFNRWQTSSYKAARWCCLVLTIVYFLSSWSHFIVAISLLLKTLTFVCYSKNPSLSPFILETEMKFYKFNNTWQIQQYMPSDVAAQDSADIQQQVLPNINSCEFTLSLGLHLNSFFSVTMGLLQSWHLCWNVTYFQYRIRGTHCIMGIIRPVSCSMYLFESWQNTSDS